MNSKGKRSGVLDSHFIPGQKMIIRKMSDPDIHHVMSYIGSPIGSCAPRSAAISIPQNRPTQMSPEQSSGNQECKKFCISILIINTN